MVRVVQEVRTSLVMLRVTARYVVKSVRKNCYGFWSVFRIFTVM